MVGTSSCTFNVVTYQHPNTPPATRVRNVYSFQISAQNVFSDPEVFRDRLTFESNRYDILDARVEEFNSDNLYLSSFSVNFNFVAVSRTSVVLESKALVTGRWDRVGVGEYRFQSVARFTGYGSIGGQWTIWQRDPVCGPTISGST